MGAFRVLLLTFVFVSYTCEASPVAHNTFRSVIDQYIANATAADIIADALVVALKENRTPLENVRYDVGASAPQAVVSVEVNDVSSAEVPDSSLELKAAAERLSEMKAKQKLVSIEILKVNDGGNPRPKKIRKIRRRKLVTKGSLRLSTAQPRPVEETSTPPPEASPSELPSTTLAASSAATASTPTPTKAVSGTTERVSFSTETTTTSTVMPSTEETTVSPAETTTTTSASSELPTSSEQSTPPVETIVSDNKFADLPENSAHNSVQTEFVNSTDRIQNLNSVTEAATSTSASAVSTDSPVTSYTENIPAQDSSSVRGLHADKINAENEVLASATHEQPAFTTEMPFTMEVKTLKVVSPTGDSHEVKVLSNVRKVSDVDLSHVHVYPKVPLLNEKSQLAVDIGGLRYRQTPRRIKIKVPKGGDTANIQPPKGYSLLRAEPTASASHEEFTFVREQTTVPASTSTSASLIETTTEIPSSTAGGSTLSPLEVSSESPAVGTESQETTTNRPVAETETPRTPTDQEKSLVTTEVSSVSSETTTMSPELSTEIPKTTTTRALPSTDFTNFVDSNTEVSVATSISAVETTTEPVRPTTPAAVPDLLKDLALPAGQDLAIVLDAQSQKSENSTESARNEQLSNTEAVQHVQKPEQVTEDWIPTLVQTSTPSSDSAPATSAPPAAPTDDSGPHRDQEQPNSFEDTLAGVPIPPQATASAGDPGHPPLETPETSIEPAVTTPEVSTEKQDQVTTTLLDTETEIVTEKPSDITNPIASDSPLRNQVVDGSVAESEPNNFSGTSSESREADVNTPNNQSENTEELPENPRPDTPPRSLNGAVDDTHVPAPPQNEPAITSPVESIPSDVPQSVPGNIPTSEAVTEPARNERTGGQVADGQQISDDKSDEQGSRRNERQDPPPDDLQERPNLTESAAVTSDSDKRVEVHEELIVPQRFPELHDSQLKDLAPESKEVSEEVAPVVPTETPEPDTSAEELDSTTPTPADIGTTESAEVRSEVPAEFRDVNVETSSESAEQEAPKQSEVSPIPLTVIPSAPPAPSTPGSTESPHRMVVLDRMNVPVLPFGGSRFAELSLQKTDDGSMKMVINDVMAIIREQDMPPSGEEELRSSGERDSEDDKTNPPPILSQPKTEPPRSIVTQVPQIGNPGKTLMPDAPTIIMQIPANTPQVKFSLRRIPGHINVPSVYEILDPERRSPARSTPQIENGRAIVTLPLLPLRALPPIQQNYYRYNRIPDQAPQPQQRQRQRQQQQQHHFTTPQTFFPQDVYPQQFQTSFPQNYERLFPQSYPGQQGNIFYINTKRRSR